MSSSSTQVRSRSVCATLSIDCARNAKLSAEQSGFRRRWPTRCTPAARSPANKAAESHPARRPGSRPAHTVLSRFVDLDAFVETQC